MRRVLVVANQTLGGTPLRDRLELKRSTDRDLEVFLLLPDLPDDPGLARKRLESELAAMRARQFNAQGAVGDADPLAAVRDVMQDHRFDEILLSTLPVGASRWLRMDLPHRIERMTKLPVDHIIGEEAMGATEGEALVTEATFAGAPALGLQGPVKVLLVEDNGADAELTRLALSRSATPNEVHTVGNGAEALEWLRSAGIKSVHLMLVDLKMPVVDGFALLEALAKEYDMNDLAVVVVTTSDRMEDRERAHRLGAHAYITKEPVFPLYRAVMDGLLAEVAAAR